MNRKRILWAYIPLGFLLVASLVTGITLSLYVKEGATDYGSYGVVSLRSYFHQGSGTSEDPYVITRPRHLYNLSRLQGLGVFGSKSYFELGLKGLDPDHPKDYMCYVDDSTNETQPYLNMESSTASYQTIQSIGSEALPFFGEFNGNNLEIKNLSVYADPEDAGIFGYTAHGSMVHNLFLDNVTIYTLGYETSAYGALYGDQTWFDTEAQYVFYNYDGGGNATTTAFDSFSSDYVLLDLPYTGDGFDWSTDGYAEEDPTPVPHVIAVPPTGTNYTYRNILSSELLMEYEEDGSTAIKANLAKVFDLFKNEIDSNGNPSYPLQAVATASMVAIQTDSLGLEHSKVILNLDFLFSLQSEPVGSTPSKIEMEVRLGQPHSNNIGIFIGHCAGSIWDCYVHDATFSMNVGGGSYTPMENKSSIGLIGLVGNNVNNILGRESDSLTESGKDIGVLDFTTIYDDIIDDDNADGATSWSNSASNSGGGITYEPIVGNKYWDYLRTNNAQQKVTRDTTTVSFRGQTVIQNNDLGIFTLATDYQGDNTGGNSPYHLAFSAISKEGNTSVTVSDQEKYFVYYCTGEYQKSIDSSFNDYRLSYSDSSPTNAPQMTSGYRFPNANEVSVDGFDYRDQHQNYIVRFSLDPSYRRSHGFYFSDVDTTTIGGSFLSKHFTNKLVDQNGFPVTKNMRGVMLRDSFGQEVSKFESSFELPEAANYNLACIDNAAFQYPIANTVNFEIKTDMANVTVVASPKILGGSASVGVYETSSALETDGREVDGVWIRIKDKKSYEPDYAFFMPDNNHLCYYDYWVENGSGKVGNYDYSASRFVSTTSESEEGVMPYSQEFIDSGRAEYGYASGKTRLFAHTFLLPRGRYCISSADNTAKIYYVCAQGQDDGQLSFSGNVFGNDVADRTDFLKSARFNNDGSENVVIPSGTPPYEYMKDGEEDYLQNQRCYVALLDSNRSVFASTTVPVSELTPTISFVYDDDNDKFILTAGDGNNAISAITHITVTNYQPPSSYVTSGGPEKTLVVSLLGIENTDSIRSYSYES